jgi:hypothetical protein
MDNRLLSMTFRGHCCGVSLGGRRGQWPTKSTSANDGPKRAAGERKAITLANKLQFGNEGGLTHNPS